MKPARLLADTLILVGLLALVVRPSAGHGAQGSHAPDNAAAPQPKVTSLMQQALAEEFTPGREVLVHLVEFPPHATLERHWHPGEEFHYYLEGDAEIRIDGRPPIKGVPGTAGHVPYKAVHTAVAGAKGAKVLVVRVHTKGEPWRYVAGEGPGKP